MPFRALFQSSERNGGREVTAALSRLRAGNTADSKSVGKGVSELRINWGPGYRLYYGWDGLKLVILLTGSAKKAKKQQSADISSAQNFWVDYKRRKGKGAS